ncbi:MAG: primosomal protein N', partial [Bdellovibrionales bacterium]|nr:primosomal protein N' [Bdellovibrionales bacterium]
LILAPEIALTPMLFSRFKSRLREPIAILHSGLSERERSRQWHLLREGKVAVALGARSSILAPIRNPGLIIVDEEHESAFKQEDRLRYNARDMAILLGSRSGATVVLGSATPSLESYHHARTGKYRHLELRSRITGHSLPEVRIVDLRKCAMTGSISPPLRLALEETLKEKRQAMLLLNRRGFSSSLICARCGEACRCPNCSVSLTWYQTRAQLLCHYCAHQERAPGACPHCGSPEWGPGARGTESLENEVRGLFPEARVLRIDRESMAARGRLEDALVAIARGEADIIVGTQMIAKGHDFPGVTLVGVLDADGAINLPDFRSSERSFQLFTQMAGRAGRGDWFGRVIMQTYNPDHPSILLSARHDFRAFAEWELENRLRFRYPPFTRMARVLSTDASEPRARAAAEKMAGWVRAWENASVELLGPAPSLLSRVQGKYRWNFLLKSAHPQGLHHVLSSLEAAARKGIPASTAVQIDVDPATLM